MNYLARAHELHPELIRLRRTIHQHPETGLDTPVTLEFVRSQLQEMGLNPTPCGHGLTAIIGKNENGPLLLMRSDMDALPMPEESGLPFASEVPGKGHCCGHDNHVAMLLGAARMLKENEEQLAGRIKLMFQPGEETGEGCLDMIDAGVLENPCPDAAMALHVDALLPLGHFGWGQGATFCSNDIFEITVVGKSCHGARPHQGIDAINASAHLVLALEALIAREADPSETDILTICSIESSSKASNIFPESVLLKGTLRTYNDAQRTLLLRRLGEVCEGIQATFGCQCLFHPHNGMNPVVLDLAMEEEIKGMISAALEGEAVLEPTPVRKMGSEDFAGVTGRLPSAFFFVGAGPDREHPYICGQHNSKVVFNEDCLPLGAAALAACAEGWLKNHS